MASTQRAARRVMRGTYAELWVNGRRIAELTNFKAEVQKTYGALELCGDTWERQRKTSQKGTLSFDIYRVDSFFDREEVAALETTADPSYTIISKIADPDSAGTERWAYYNCEFENITLADFAAKQFAKRTVSAHFAGCENLDGADPQ